MTSRKTFKVEDFKKHMNMLLASELDVLYKRAVADTLEQVLHETGNYKGFNYIILDGIRPCLDGKPAGDCTNPLFTARHEMMRRYY